MTWTMPRDMSKFSTLEAALLAAVNAAGLPEPVAELAFDRCCPHLKALHHGAEKSRPPRHWYHAPPSPAYCGGCHLGGHNHEYRKGRAWRFDFAWPALKVAAECEGGTYSGGRHTTGTGFEKDAEKYNAAAERGWTVLRFTQRQITSGAALETLERVLSRATEQIEA